MATFDDIAARGNRYTHPPSMSDSRIRCADGFTVSVIAGLGTYCDPLPDDAYRGPYVAVEVGYPSLRPEPWDQWEAYCEDPASPTDTVYSYVPVDAVRALIASHGGEIR